MALIAERRIHPSPAGLGKETVLIEERIPKEASGIGPGRKAQAPADGFPVRTADGRPVLKAFAGEKDRLRERALDAAGASCLPSLD
jgi:hypothetical protein